VDLAAANQREVSVRRPRASKSKKKPQGCALRYKLAASWRYGRRKISRTELRLSCSGTESEITGLYARESGGLESP